MISLKSLATDRSINEVSTVADSDIHSYTRTRRWINDQSAIIDLTSGKVETHQPQFFEEAAPVESELFGGKFVKGEPSDEKFVHSQPFKEMTPSDSTIPRGVVRPVSNVHYHSYGLYISTRIARHWVQLASGSTPSSTAASLRASNLVHFLTQWRDPLILGHEDLMNLEHTWTGTGGHFRQYSLLDSSIYTLIEFSTFFSPDWGVIRSMTYVAMSKGALNLLKSLRHWLHNFGRVVPVTTTDLGRRCSGDVLQKAVACIRFGSLYQHFAAAISRSCHAVFPILKDDTDGATTPVIALGFSELHQSRLEGVVYDYHNLPASDESSDLMKDLFSVTAPAKLNILCRDKYMPNSIVRGLVRIVVATEDGTLRGPHETTTCGRCHELSNIHGLAQEARPESPEVRLSSDHTVLVLSLSPDAGAQSLHRICLFHRSAQNLALEKLGEAVNQALEEGAIYRTFSWPLSPYSYQETDRLDWMDRLWNLPVTQWSTTEAEAQDIQDWIFELSGFTTARRNPSIDFKRLWDGLQMRFHLHQEGVPWEDTSRRIDALKFGATTCAVLRRHLYKRTARKDPERHEFAAFKSKANIGRRSRGKAKTRRYPLSDTKRSNFFLSYLALESPHWEIGADHRPKLDRRSSCNVPGLKQIVDTFAGSYQRTVEVH